MQAWDRFVVGAHRRISQIFYEKRFRQKSLMSLGNPLLRRLFRAEESKRKSSGHITLAPHQLSRLLAHSSCKRCLSMGMDSKTRKLLTLWRDLSPEAKARMFEKARYLALSAGLEKTPEFEAFFELPTRDFNSDR